MVSHPEREADEIYSTNTLPAGKSTLLQILAGKRLIKSSDVRVFSKDVFRDSPPVCLIYVCVYVFLKYILGNNVSWD